MTKEVMVSIRGLQFDQEMDSEEIESIIKKMIRTISYMMSLWRAVTSRLEISSSLKNMR